MVRIGSRKWTADHIGQLLVLIDAGSSAASAAILLKRPISVVRNKARSLGKPFPIAASLSRFAVQASARQTRAR
jgi:hypothetical protein